MKTGSATNIIRGGFNPENIRTFIKCALVAILSSSLLLVIGTAINQLLSSAPASVKITNWEYIWSDSKKKLDNINTGWQKTEANIFKNEEKESSMKYLHLRTTFKANTGFTYILSLRTGNSPIDVYIDGEPVVTQLNEKESFSGSPLVEVVLGPSGEDREIDVLLFTPATLKFDAQVQKSVNGKANVRPIEITEIVYGSIFIGFGLILLAVAVIIIIKNKKQNVLLLMGSYCTAFGFGITLNQSGVYISGQTSPLFFKATVSLLMFTSFLMLLTALRMLDISRNIRWILYINALYALCYLVAPYPAIEVFLIKTFWIISFADLVVFCAALVLKGTPSSGGKAFIAVSYIIAVIGQTVFWASFMFPYDTAGKEMCFLGIGLNIICVVTYMESNTLIGSSLFRSSEKVFTNANVLGQASKLIIEKADTNSNHLENVSAYVAALCTKLKMSPESTAMVSGAALLHDIGKIAVPRAVIEKQDFITPEEYDQIRCHVLHGYNILTDTNDKFLQMAATIARNHHERYDGSGYLGLKGDEIDIYSQITALSDTFDALTAYRPYKKAWSFNEAWDYINTHAGDFFDPELVKVFNACRKEFWEIYQKKNKTDI